MIKHYIFSFITFGILSLSAYSAIHNVNVGQSGNSFSPSNVIANIGDTIQWTKVGSFHTTTSTNIPTCATAWNNNMDISTTFQYIIELSGTYDYKCSNHGGMTGTITVAGTPINTAMIPDDNLRSFLMALYPAFFCGNQLLTDSAATVTGSMDCSSHNIANLSGIQYFIGITDFDCSNNSLTVISALPPALTNLNCSNNQITSLPSLTPSSINILNCNNNNLSTLPTLPVSITELYCINNKISVLPLLSFGLTKFSCDSNKLDFSDAAALRMIDTISTLTNFTYAFQKPFGSKTTILSKPDSLVILSIAVQDSATGYQWFKDGNVLSNADSNILIFPSVQEADSGIYTCLTYGKALLSPPMIFGPGIDSFVSETIKLRVDTSFSDTTIIDTSGGDTMTFIRKDVIGTLSIYPNPNNGNFTIAGLDLFLNNENMQLRIYNIFGQEVYAENIFKYYNTKRELSLTEYATGIYIIKLVSDKKILSQNRLIINK